MINLSLTVKCSDAQLEEFTRRSRTRDCTVTSQTIVDGVTRIIDLVWEEPPAAPVYLEQPLWYFYHEHCPVSGIEVAIDFEMGGGTAFSQDGYEGSWGYSRERQVSYFRLKANTEAACGKITVMYYQFIPVFLLSFKVARKNAQALGLCCAGNIGKTKQKLTDVASGLHQLVEDAFNNLLTYQMPPAEPTEKV